MYPTHTSYFVWSGGRLDDIKLVCAPFCLALRAVCEDMQGHKDWRTVVMTQREFGCWGVGEVTVPK